MDLWNLKVISSLYFHRWTSGFCSKKSCWGFNQLILIHHIGGQVCVNSNLVVMWTDTIRSNGCYVTLAGFEGMTSLEVVTCNLTGQINWIYCDEILSINENNQSIL